MMRSIWSPFRDMEELLDRYQRGVGRPASSGQGGGHEVMTTADWVPPVDISETADEFLIKVELPEVSKNDVRASIKAGVLLIEGERKFEEEQGRKHHRVERPFGRFARSFTLPEDVEETGIKAEHRDGILWIRLKKHEKPQPKSIEIKVS